MSVSPFGRKAPAYVHAGRLHGDTGEHAYPFAQLYFLAAGGGRLRVGQTYPLKRGDLVILDRDVAYSLCPDEGAVCYCLGVQPADGGHLLTNKPFRIIPAGTEEIWLGALFAQLADEAPADRPDGRPILERLAQLVLLYAARLAAADVTFDGGTADAIIAYLNAHYPAIDSLDQAADALSVNKFRLTHIVKEQTGLPPMRYVLHKRIELAEKLLATSERAVKDVAAQCGFSDAPYFCRVFKQIVGCTPLQYRYKSRAKH